MPDTLRLLCRPERRIAITTFPADLGAMPTGDRREIVPIWRCLKTRSFDPQDAVLAPRRPPSARSEEQKKKKEGIRARPVAFVPPDMRLVCEALLRSYSFDGRIATKLQVMAYSNGLRSYGLYSYGL